MKPLVSILIPCYNSSAWLRETLDSAFAQTWERCEVILVDDGSSDDSVTIAREYESAGLKLFLQPNRGAASARNKALQASTGDYIQYLDADDLLAPDKIARQLDRLLNATSQEIASGPWSRFVHEPEEAVFITEATWRDMDGLEFQLLHYEAGWMMQPAAWLCPRRLLNEIGPWDETLSLNDDGEYFSRVMMAAKGILFCPNARTYYRSEIVNSLSRRIDAAALRSLWKSTELNCNRLLKVSEKSERARDAVANGWKRLAFELYPTLPELANQAEAKMWALGGTTHPLQVGKLFRYVSKIFGWRFAKRLQQYFNNQR